MGSADGLVPHQGKNRLRRRSPKLSKSPKSPDSLESPPTDSSMWKIVNGRERLFFDGQKVIFGGQLAAPDLADTPTKVRPEPA